MQKTTPRRRFIQNTLKATSCLVILPSATLAAKPLSSNSALEKKIPRTKLKDDIRKNPFGKHLKVTGKVFDRETLLPISGVLVEFWHFSSKDIERRGNLLTNAEGEYRLLTGIPDKLEGKMPRLYFKVSHQDKTMTTELLCNKSRAEITGEHWESHRVLSEGLLFPKLKKQLNTIHINFNLTL